MRITVVGAGISGLSTAFILSKSGHKVHLIAKEFSPNITSNRAAAFWFPYHIRNDIRGVEWCKKSYEVYKSFTSDPSTGVTMKKIIKGVRNILEEDTSWIEYMPPSSCKIVDEPNLPAGYSKAYEAEVPLIETQIFLPWLLNRVIEMGVTIEKKNITSFNEVDNCEFIINCSSLGSKDLLNDEELIAIRGQVALLQPIDFPHIFLENEKPLYIVPRKDVMIIGGTFEENIYDETTDPQTIDILLNNAFEIYPELRSQKLIGSWSGLRPYRKKVRLEAIGNIIHNYGHGGSGFTLSWGCAENVNEILNGLKN